MTENSSEAVFNNSDFSQGPYSDLCKCTGCKCEPTAEVVETGTWVVYDGSMEDYAGQFMFVDGNHKPYSSFGPGDTVRYFLRYGINPTEILSNVRPQSFKPVMNA